MTRAQKQSSFCLLQNRRPESQSPTFHRPADRGYNTLDFASKVRVPKRGVPPLDSPVISVSRIQNRPCRFYILTPEIKEAPSPSSKGMLTVLLYNYPKVAFLQYCVSVGCGVVSLTKGTSGFIFGYSLSADADSVSKLILRHTVKFSKFNKIILKHFSFPLFQVHNI